MNFKEQVRDGSQFIKLSEYETESSDFFKIQFEDSIQKKIGDAMSMDNI